MKMVEDLIDYDNTSKDTIYVIAEIGLKVFLNEAKSRHWNITPCTLKMPLPRTIVKRLPDHQASQNLLKRYLK